MEPAFLLLLLFAFSAGFIDSIAGGGGLIQLPALLIFLPSYPIGTIMGTNKFAAFSGTGLATFKYLRHTEVPWRNLLPGIFTALIFSYLGAHIVSAIPREYMKLIALTLLFFVAVYTFTKKDLGMNHEPITDRVRIIILSSLTGALMGFYDGFFGPGTGSFLIVIFITLFGFNFLIASASAKLINSATNVSALFYFLITGQIDFKIAIPVAICNMTGSFIGSRLVIKKGSGFVKPVFLIMVSALILKLAFDLLKS